jgi:hypothetical protein
LEDAPSHRRRDSKKTIVMSAEEKNKLLLQHYNDLRHEEERKEYPCKLIMLLRIALRLRNLREEMYKFPLQEYV